METQQREEGGASRTQNPGEVGIPEEVMLVVLRDEQKPWARKAEELPRP